MLTTPALVLGMARGWESKSVESQIEDAATLRTLRNQVLQTEEQIRVAREIEVIELSRTRILREIAETVHPRRREQLSAALAFLDLQLKQVSGKTSVPKLDAASFGTK